MIKPEGIIPAMITPFTSDQEVSEQGIRKLVNDLIESGVHGLFCLGTNGEFFSLTFDEKVEIARIIVDEAKGRVPIYVGAGCISTKETISLAKKMEQLNVDALSVITPYFLAFSQEELYEHFKQIANSTRLPIILYNIPDRTGNSLQAHTVVRLSEIDNIVGMKDSSGKIDNILQYLDAVNPNFSVLAGTDSLILPTLMAGGKGAIAATANVLPQTVVSIYENWKIGKYEEAQIAQDQLRDLRLAIKLGTLPAALKEALNYTGFPAGPSRLPVEPLSSLEKSKLEHTMKKYNEKNLINSV
ncbi:4-hydroxy-tetrahydrodipicolinate synthase [uncultured Metabacillus sp.]|uniref:4-hydroxy-tetrahydrodipicolinate synthase n=1 Tax=uncultured Metabacillus sp. TaxID=2860135 RepID=UPI002604EAC3|nr:4-hydroxy-tetrahydrodipicolinate synthase [uncultured Metabacillus sp.]